jgi:hypothetical protein
MLCCVEKIIDARWVVEAPKAALNLFVVDGRVVIFRFYPAAFRIHICKE